MRPHFDRIICGVDSSEHGETVLATALDLAAHYRSELIVVNVLESIRLFRHARMEEYVTAEQLAALESEGRARIEQSLRNRLDAVVEEGQRDALESTRIEFVEGRPSTALIELATAEQAGLIVVGSHGHGAVGELLLGSTAHEICQKASQPVLLVPIGR